MVIEELLKLCTCNLVFSEELKLCLYIYNIRDHVHSFNSLLNTGLPAYTQLQFLTEHKSACVYTLTLSWAEAHFCTRLETIEKQISGGIEALYTHADLCSVRN